MKNLKTMFSLFLIVTALATGCKKDEDGPSSGNSKYVYQGTTTKITAAKFFNVAVLGTNVMNIVLTGEGTSKNLQLFFYKGSTSIPVGTFTYKDNSSASYNPASNFSGGSIKLDIPTSHEITGGTVAVSKDGDNYSINLDAQTTRGPVTATYHGKITPQ